MGKNVILEEVLKEFEKLASIPRKTGHEKAVSDYLRDYMRELGLDVMQDEKLNLIAECPAAKGWEQVPRTILQAHMDMVCVAEEGVSYDPLKDPIRLLRDETFLRAEGTSLGADDGIGIAEILYILKHLDEHGPLRVIFTVDEEQGMSGAEFLDPKYLQDADYLINCDSENYDELTIGCAGNVVLSFARELHWKTPSYADAYRLEVKGLLGGHSGERIGDGRGNALRILAQVLREVQMAGNMELCSFSGGKAQNAIPENAKACFVTDCPREKLEQCLDACREKIRSIYGAVEKTAILECMETEMPSRVMLQEEADALLRLLTIFHTGVYAMSQTVSGLVETSANLGIVSMGEDQIQIQILPRSAVDQKLEEFCRLAEDLGELTGFKVKCSSIKPGWKERSDSRLAQLMNSIFEEQQGKPMRVGAIHAGVECGWHFKKNPKLDIVSIGVTTIDIHSPQERLLLETVKPQVELIQETLKRIKL